LEGQNLELARAHINTHPPKPETWKPPLDAWRASGEGTPVDVYRMACFYLNVLDQARSVSGVL